MTYVVTYTDRDGEKQRIYVEHTELAAMLAEIPEWVTDLHVEPAN